ncbi:hypothetical protein BgiBS90_010069, partial [Biomphalaria glabrata]
MLKIAKPSTELLVPKRPSPKRRRQNVAYRRTSAKYITKSGSTQTSQNIAWM